MPRTSRVRGRRVTAVVLAAMATLAACTTDGEQEARPAPKEARAGGTLRVAITKPGSVEPGNAYEPAGALVVRTMCDTLLAIDPKTGELRPGLADSWIISDSGARFTVKLRKGLKFSDGSKVTADDVVWSLSRIADMEYASYVATLMSPVAGYDVLRQPPKPDDDRRRSLKGIRVIEGASFEITLTEKNADWLRVLAHPATAPTPRKVAEADPAGFARRPVCAGPYRLAEPWSPDATTVRLERVPDRDAVNGAYTGGGAGYADTIDFTVVADASAATDSWKRGEVDIARVPLARLDEARATGAVVGAPEPAVDFIGLSRSTTPAFSDARVRRALSRALNREAVTAAVYAGGRLPATGFLPPTLGRAYAKTDCPDAPAAGDVEGARALLREAGVDLTGLTVAVTFNDEFRHRAMVENVVQQWRDAFGLNLQPQPLPWEEYQRVAASPKGFEGAFRVGWTSAVASPDAFLHPLFSSAAVGRTNLSRFANVQFDRRLDRDARRAISEDDRRLGYVRLTERLCREMPLVPVTVEQAWYLVSRDRVASAAGVWTEVASGDPVLRELYLKDAR